MSDTAREEEIKKALEEKFPDAVYEASVSRPRRVWAGAAPERALQVMAFLKEKGYNHLSTITGFDEGEKLGAIYHITNQQIVVNLKVRTPKASPVLQSVINVFPVCVSFEKELQDMFGIKVEGLPEGRRYPLPDDFPADIHPLRKEVKVDELIKILDGKTSTEAK